MLERLLGEVVIEAHLRTTWRKVEHGQKCSLRFYLDGLALRPTGIDTKAGYSLSRLPNVFRILADVGLCNNVDRGRFQINAEGIGLLKELKG